MSECAFRVLKRDVWMLSGALENLESLEFFKAITSTAYDLGLCILIESSGGNYAVTHGIIHHLAKFNHRELRVVGEACSAAVDLVCLGGTLRTAVPGAVFFTHPTYLTAEVRPGSGTSIGVLMKQEEARRAKLYARRTGKTVRFWERFFEQDQWFGADRALELEIIDEIL